MLVLGKSLRNNAPPMILLTHHPGISSNITKATHFSMPATPTTLANQPLYPRWCTTHGTHAGTLSQHSAHITHASMSNTPSTLARLSRKHVTHGTHDSTNSTPFLKLLGIQLTLSGPLKSMDWFLHDNGLRHERVKLSKLLGLKFQEEIWQFLLLIFIFTTFTFQVFLSIFIEVWKTAIEKINFFRGN